jgi:D-xylose transport system permease protein
MPESSTPGPVEAPPGPEGAVDEELTSRGRAMDALTINEATVDSFQEYVRAWITRVRSGDSGALPVIVGLILLAIIFQTQNSHFITARNITNLLSQGSVTMLLAMGIVFVLLLGEIDLSMGYVAGVGAVITAELVKQPHPHNWVIAVGAALIATSLIGLFQGLIITFLGLPAFVVTLAGYLGWQGVIVLILGNGQDIPINDHTINDFYNGYLTTTAGWILCFVGVGLYAAAKLYVDNHRRRSGLAAPPLSLTISKIILVAVFTIAVTWVCNSNRGTLVPIRGVPYVVLIVVVFLGIYTFVQSKTRFGRYIYAIGGNSEAARRAGINTVLIRTAVFTLAGFAAGVAGVVYASRLQSVSTNIDGGTLVLYCIAAAVIGGTSLFGGRGKAINAIIGGLVIAAIDNGMGLLNVSAAARFIVTALVLLAAVAVDAIARRGRAKAGVV